MRDRCPVGMRMQSIMFARKGWPLHRAVAWLRRNNFRREEADVGRAWIRFRQAPTSEFREGSFRTIELRRGVRAVVGCPA